jgi:hypothetical protein
VFDPSPAPFRGVRGTGQTAVALHARINGGSFDSCSQAWLPRHFQAEWTRIVAHLENIRAQNVVVATVPHVTVAPIARGVGDKMARGSRYFAHYTRP